MVMDIFPFINYFLINQFFLMESVLIGTVYFATILAISIERVDGWRGVLLRNARSGRGSPRGDGWSEDGRRTLRDRTHPYKDSSRHGKMDDLMESILILNI